MTDLWLTEEEARAKTCPASIARDSSADARCQGADCMAWRWAETHAKNEAGDGLKLTHDTYGFCGLAGFPNPRGERRAPDMELQQIAARTQADTRSFVQSLRARGADEMLTRNEAVNILDLVDRLARTLQEIA